MNKPNEAEAILYAFAVEAKGDNTVLEKYLRQYPELSDELIDLASELRLSALVLPSGGGEIADPNGPAAWEEFLGCKPLVARKTEDLFARFKGEAFANLADAMKVPRSILTALRDGLVTASSIPQGFVQRFADAASESVDVVWQCLRHPQPPMAREFKSASKPTCQGQTTFRELVENTEMLDDQRELLFRDLSEDGRNCRRSICRNRLHPTRPTTSYRRPPIREF